MSLFLCRPNPANNSLVRETIMGSLSAVNKSRYAVHYFQQITSCNRAVIKVTELMSLLIQQLKLRLRVYVQFVVQ
jgi:hypothetical protein